MPRNFASYADVTYYFQGANLRMEIPYAIETLNLAYNWIPQAFDYEMHQVANLFIAIPKIGNYRCVLNGKGLEVKPGQLLLVAPGQNHQDKVLAKTSFYSFQCLLKNARNPQGNVTIFNDTVTPEEQIIDISQPLQKQFNILVENITQMKPGVLVRFIHAQFLAFFEGILQSFPSRILCPDFVQNDTNFNFHQQMLRLFEDNLMDNLTLTDICRKMHMGRSALYDKSISSFRTGPVKAFHDYKLWVVRKMLQTSECSIKELAERYGFLNQMHLSRMYKKKFLESPSETAKNWKPKP